MSQESREIRVFISSTFSDMQEERKYLNTKIFPELRAICQKRGVVFTEVDLQWGITEDQAKDGAAVEVCLEEINRCQPYFIGLLGERYGWSPKDNGLTIVPVSNDSLKSNVQGWLEKGESVTAMEIMHGVLDSKKQADLSCFYFRDKQYTKGLLLKELEEKKFKQDENTVMESKDSEKKQEEKRVSYVFMEPECSEKEQKLKKLKERILANEGGWHVRKTFTDKEDNSCDGYTDIEQLGAQIRDDLLTIINERFPEGENLSAIDKERRFHAVFADSRLQVYIPDENLITSIFDTLKSNDTPLVISGKMGSGKSALLAKFSEGWKEEHSNGLVIEHYAGSGGESGTVGVLRRVMSEIKHEYNIEENLPSSDDDIYQKFTQWLFYVTEKKPLLLVLDGVNQFGSGDSLRRFVHILPEHSGDHIRIVLSTLEGDVLNAVNDREWSVKTVEPLAEEQRAALATQYLEQYSKNLDKKLIDRLVSSDAAENPLFLRVVLDELRLDATHDDLEEMLGSYLKAKDLVALFEMVLARCEKVYTNSHVPHILSLIWASRYGLSDHELREICNEESESHVAQLYISRLIFGLGGYLADREGLYGFMHDALRQAVEKKYITPTVKQEAHSLIAGYFSKEDVSNRQIDELPWHIVKIGDQAWLFEYLTNMNVFMAFSKRAAWMQELYGYEVFDSNIFDNDKLMDQYESNNYDSRKKILFYCLLGEYFLYIESLKSKYHTEKYASGVFSEALSIVKEHKDNYGIYDENIHSRILLGGARAYLQDGENDKARSAIDSLFGVVQLSSGVKLDSSPLFQVLIVSCEISLEKSDILGAQEHLENAIKVLDTMRKNHSHIDGYKINYISSLIELEKGNFENSRTMVKESIRTLKNHYGDSFINLDICNGMKTLANLEESTGDIEKAVKLLKEAHSTTCDFVGKYHQLAENIRTEIGCVLCALGDVSSASSVSSDSEQGILDKSLFRYAGFGRLKECERLIGLGASEVLYRTKSSALMNAAQNGHEKICSLLIGRFGNINATSDKGDTALMLASDCGHWEVCKLLLESGANTNEKDDALWTALMSAACNGYVEIFNLLIDYGADINAVDHLGRGALMLASRNGHLEIVQMLISSVTDIDRPLFDGMTPLIAASYNGYTEVCKLLLEHGANIKLARNDGVTALLAAASNRKWYSCSLMLEYGADVNWQDSEGRSSLLIAAGNGDMESCQGLIKQKAKVNLVSKLGRTPLIDAAMEGHQDICLLLLESEADVSLVSNDGWSPLMHASNNGHASVCNLLLEHGANIDQETIQGWTALMFAAQGGDPKVCEILIQNHAQIELANGDGWTALFVASRNGHSRVAKLLVEQGAEINGSVAGGWTPLHIASRNGHVDVCRLLVPEGAKVNALSDESWGALPLAIGDAGNNDIFQLLLEAGAEVDVANDYGWTSLMFAAKKGFHTLSSQLIANGASINRENSGGWPPLMLAANGGHYSVCKLLIEKGAYVDAADNRNSTALMIAAENGFLRICQLLIENDAEVNAVDIDGSTALMVASKFNQLRVCKLLLKREAKLSTSDSRGCTALMFSAIKGDSEVCELLIGHGAELNATSKDGLTALRCAYVNDEYGVCDLLIEHGANPKPAIQDGLSIRQIKQWENARNMKLVERQEAYETIL